MKAIKHHHRKSICLKGYNYSQPTEYFVTICTHNHECILVEIVDREMRLNAIGKIVEECWKEIPNHFKNVELDEFENKMSRKAGQHSQASGCPIICMESSK